MSDYIVNVCGDSSNAAWLIKGRANILYDTGMAYSADKMIENIKRELGQAPLDAVILSHSHYDHVAGLPFIKKEWPSAVVYASAYAAGILEKASVRETMRKLSGNAAGCAGLSKLPPYDDGLLKVDVTVKDGDVLTIGDHRITVFETPGHTKCSVSYLVDDDVLMASETIGVFKGEWYMPCYLVGYQMTVDAVKKLRNAGAKRLFISHRGICEETDLEQVWGFLSRRLEETKNEIIEIIKTCKTKEERLAVMKERYHDSVVSEIEQPSSAFLLNAAATLNIVEKECMEGNA